MKWWRSRFRGLVLGVGHCAMLTWIASDPKTRGAVLCFAGAAASGIAALVIARGQRRAADLTLTDDFSRSYPPAMREKTGQMRCDLCGEAIAGNAHFDARSEKISTPFGSHATVPFSRCRGCANRRRATWRVLLWGLGMLILGIVMAALAVAP